MAGVTVMLRVARDLATRRCGFCFSIVCLLLFFIFIFVLFIITLSYNITLQKYIT